MEKSINNEMNIWVIAGILTSWATFWMYLLSPFGFLIWTGILIYLIIKKTKLKWYLILSAWIFVPSCNFLNGTVHYMNGTATLKGVGGPQTFKSVDIETRVMMSSAGCIFIGFEPFVFTPNNAAIRFWTYLFGFQEGAYNGVFPTEQEALEILKSADTINVKHIDNFLQFITTEQIVNLDSSYFCRSHCYANSFDKVVGKTIDSECFIFKQFDTNNVLDTKTIYIVDINNNRLLTKYFD